MESETDKWEIQELIDLRENGDLRVNPEYQRGAVWNESQMRLLVDSIFRGYQIPLIYLRKVEKIGKRASSTHYDIIDGQQRINAMRSFVRGAVIDENRSGDRGARPFKPLYDPSQEEDKEMFPYALLEANCPWAGKVFRELKDTLLGTDFLGTKVPVVVMKCNDNEARDLFIRLQGGSDLKPQEVRDAWPGNFCQLVLEIGGKPQMNQPGHAFFLKAMKARPAGDRGKTRQLVAQLLMLFLEQKEHGRGHYVSTKSSILDGFYRNQAGLDLDSPKVERFREILDQLGDLFGDGKRPPLKVHDAIHLILFTDMLMSNYVRGWEEGLVAAFDKFAATLGEAKQYDDQPVGKSKDFQDIWSYYWKTRTNADYPATIQRRHEIYSAQMLRFLDNKAKEKDSQRGYTPAQREGIYFRDGKKCHFCQKEVAWDDAEIHHLEEHSKGGATTLENGVLVHKKCHPRGRPKGG